jgi:hypothetical protein
MKKCPQCNIEKKLEEYSKNKNKSDGLQRMCKPCVAIQSKKSYDKDSSKYKERVKSQNLKSTSYINDFKSNHPCNKCGESRIWLLDFHHTDPTVKEYSIGTLKGSGQMDKIKEEIEKCIVLCSNCHRDFHYQEKINNTTIEEYIARGR